MPVTHPAHSSAFAEQSLTPSIVLNQLHENQQDCREIPASEAARKDKDSWYSTEQLNDNSWTQMIYYVEYLQISLLILNLYNIKLKYIVYPQHQFKSYQFFGLVVNSSYVLVMPLIVRQKWPLARPGDASNEGWGRGCIFCLWFNEGR